MNKSLARVLVVVTAVAIAGSALSGCTPTSAHPSAHHTHAPASPRPSGSASASANPSSSPTPSATPAPVAVPFPQNLGPLPANALFRITALGVQPNGATIDLVQTVFAPTAPVAADTALLNTQCNDSGSPTWQSSYPGGYKFVDTTLTATVDTTKPAFNTRASIATSFDLYVAAFSGAYQTAQAYCASGYIGLPGTMHGVGAVLASNPAGGSLGWASHDRRYGFYGDGNDPGDPNGGDGDTIVKGCAVTISAAALAAAPAIASWQTQPYVQKTSCYYVP